MKEISNDANELHFVVDHIKKSKGSINGVRSNMLTHCKV